MSSEFIVDFSCWLSQHMAEELEADDLRERVASWDEALEGHAQHMGINEWLSSVAWCRLFVWLAMRLKLPLRIDTPGVPFRRVYQYGEVLFMMVTMRKMPDDTSELYTDEAVKASFYEDNVERFFALYVGRAADRGTVKAYTHMLDRRDLGVLVSLVDLLAPGHDKDPGRFFEGATALWEA